MIEQPKTTGDGKVISISCLKIITRYLDSDYELREPNDLTRGKTERLKVFSLVSKIDGKPWFESRVDDGSPGKRRKPDLDIDIKGVTRDIERAFRSKKINGYIGHHTDKSEDPINRSFDVKIGIPADSSRTPKLRTCNVGKGISAAILFDGQVSFKVTFSVGAHIQGEIKVMADATVIKAA
jgi:hypothetical protein